MSDALKVAAAEMVIYGFLCGILVVAELIIRRKERK